MKKLLLALDELRVESFEAGTSPRLAGTVMARDGGCSIQPTCGNPSQGEEAFEEMVITRYACCV
jgi:hypothetical protein